MKKFIITVITILVIAAIVFGIYYYFSNNKVDNQDDDISNVTINDIHKSKVQMNISLKIDENVTTYTCEIIRDKNKTDISSYLTTAMTNEIRDFYGIKFKDEKIYEVIDGKYEKVEAKFDNTILVEEVDVWAECEYNVLPFVKETMKMLDEGIIILESSEAGLIYFEEDKAMGKIINDLFKQYAVNEGKNLGEFTEFNASWDKTTNKITGNISANETYTTLTIISYDDLSKMLYDLIEYDKSFDVENVGGYSDIKCNFSVVSVGKRGLLSKFAIETTINNKTYNFEFLDNLHTKLDITITDSISNEEMKYRVNYSINNDSNDKDDSNNNVSEYNPYVFRLVTYYLDQKKVYELEIGSTINLNDYIPTVEGYEFKGWYFNKDYTFKYSEDELNVKLENSDLSLCDDTPDIHNNSLYVYAKMLLPTEEDVTPSASELWTYQGYKDSEINIFDDEQSKQTNSLKFFKYTLNVVKDGSYYKGTANIEGTYNFSNQKYILDCTYSNEQEIKVDFSDDLFSYQCHGDFFYKRMKLYSKEDCSFIANSELYGVEPGKKADITQSILFNENSHEIIIKAEVDWPKKIAFEIKSNESGDLVISTITYFSGDTSNAHYGCNIKDKTIIENFNLNPVFTYDSNGNVTAIKIDATYQE